MTRVAVAFPLAMLTLVTVAAALPGTSHVTSTSWLDTASDPAALRQLLAENPAKVPVEFHQNLQYALPDGRLSVIVAMTENSAEAHTLAATTTEIVNWFSPDVAAFWGLATADQVANLLASPLVQFVEPDHPLSYFMAEATIADNARSASAGTGVWKYVASSDSFASDISSGGTVYTGKDVNVAVVDSGIDQTFLDFSSMGCTTSALLQPCNSRILANVKIVDEVGIDTNLQPTSALPTTDLASGHGTHVSGIVAGNAYYSRKLGALNVGGDGYQFGVAPEANLVVVSNGDVNSAALADSALGWVDRHVTDMGIKITTNSWGCLGGCAYSPSSSTSLLFKSLYDKGVVNFVAAGNDAGSGTGAEFSGYSQSPYVISVAAYDDSNDRVATFSSRGSSATAHNSLATASTWTPGSEVGGTNYARRRPDIAAPGVSIVSARSLTGGYAAGLGRLNGGDLGLSAATLFSPYVAMSGTSMATPQVAGAAAVLFDACPSATALEVMRAIMDGAGSGLKKSGTGTSAAEPFEVGYGSLDVRGALDSLQATLSSC